MIKLDHLTVRNSSTDSAMSARLAEHPTGLLHDVEQTLPPEFLLYVSKRLDRSAALNYCPRLGVDWHGVAIA